MYEHYSRSGGKINPVFHLFFLGKERGFALYFRGFGRNRGKGRGFLWWEEIGEKANNV
jgi:hypothetical protein